LILTWFCYIFGLVYQSERPTNRKNFKSSGITMALHELAGKKAPHYLLDNIPRLVAAYYAYRPDPANPVHQVQFGTSGHRGSSLKHTFNEDGPLFVGMDPHALSEPALRTALEVLAAAGVDCRFQQGFGYTPTPVISHAILTYNRGRTSGLADGLVITPSHNPPEDGGIKYNPPHGGPAGTDVTGWIEKRANALLETPGAVPRIPLARALREGLCREHDFIRPYVLDLGNAIDMQAIRSAGISIGVDPLGGAGLPFWEPIASITAGHQGGQHRG
jgi:phosphoglucomutase